MAASLYGILLLTAFWVFNFLYFFSLLNEIVKGKANIAHMVLAIWSITCLEVQKLDRAFKAFSEEAEVGSFAPLMAPHFWLDYVLGEFKVLSSL